VLIDTHAHLDSEQFKGDVSNVLGRARAAGVGKIINVGFDPISSRRALDLSRMNPEIYVAVGIHPHNSLELDIEAYQQILTLASHKKVVAIGEVGLDYYYLKRSSQYSNYPSRDHQILAFEQMLDLALELKLPVIIHAREADADILAILKSYGGEITGVVHCFSGSLDFANQLLDLGFALSFTGNITFKNNSELRDVVKRIPLGSIMVETDCPDLAPEPYRGRRNEPSLVVKVAEKIAEIKEISFEEVARTTTKKAEKLFNLK
jgi:TatD DNase family protein